MEDGFDKVSKWLKSYAIYAIKLFWNMIPHTISIIKTFSLILFSGGRKWIVSVACLSYINFFSFFLEEWLKHFYVSSFFQHFIYF